MGNEASVRKPSLTLEPSQSQSKSHTHTTITPTLSPRTPVYTPMTPTLTNKPLSLISRSSTSYGNVYMSSPSLDKTDSNSLSYSQRLGIAADSIDLPKKMDDEQIITKNQGRISKKKLSPHNAPSLSIAALSKQKTVSRFNYPKQNTNNSNHSNNASSPRKISNGIVGKYISEKIAKCASLFWINNIDILQRKQQLEIGCVLFLHLLQQHPQLNRFFKKDKIEETALRFFDMFGWLIRSLNLDGVNLWRVLVKIGEAHTKMDIKVNHYELLLGAFHHAMSQTFTQHYTISVKYCIDQIYTIATCIMTGRQYEHLRRFGERILQLNKCLFLESLTVCLEYEIGREYLYRFLATKYCSEIVLFLKLYQEYKEIFSQHHIEKLQKANEIAKISLSRNSEFPINVSYTAISEFWSRLSVCQTKYESSVDDFIIDPMLFDTVSKEIMQLILSNHWINFTLTIKKMQRQQNTVVNN